MTFDGSTLLNATDASFGAGHVGVGSPNDSAYFDDIQLVAGKAGTGGSSNGTEPLLKPVERVRLTLC